MNHSNVEYIAWQIAQDIKRGAFASGDTLPEREGKTAINTPIRVGNKARHTLSGVWFWCENAKQERWMNMNPYYVLIK